MISWRYSFNKIAFELAPYLLSNLRNDKKTYVREKNRQKLWIPEDTPGRVKDITLDPYIKRSIKSKKDDRFSEVDHDKERVRSEKDTKRSGLDDLTSP